MSEGQNRFSLTPAEEATFARVFEQSPKQRDDEREALCECLAVVSWRAVDGNTCLRCSRPIEG